MIRNQSLSGTNGRTTCTIVHVPLYMYRCTCTVTFFPVTVNPVFEAAPVLEDEPVLETALWVQANCLSLLQVT